MRRRLSRRKKTEISPAERDTAQESTLIKKSKERENGAYYNCGPALIMNNILDMGVTGAKHRASETGVSPEPLIAPEITGKGAPSHSDAKGTSVSLEGRTDADFDGGSFSTRNVRVTTASGCESCAGEGECVRARGVLVARYHVRTTVTLPSVSDFPDLTPCQRARVQSAIDNVLAPHEQDHVQAFRQYNGVIRTPFDVTICRSEFDASIQSMFDTQESARRASAQAASDVLDPFNFTIDIDCEEPAVTEPVESKRQPSLAETGTETDDSIGVGGSMQQGATR